MNRTFDSTVLEYIGGHPSVRQLTNGIYEIEGSAEDFVKDNRNIVFADDHSFIALHYAAPRTYAAHYAFLAGHRGKEALSKCKWAIDQMFGLYNAQTIWACAPLQLRASTLMIRWLGFERVSAFDNHEYYVLKGFKS